MRCLAIIPARGGSKRIPHKNIKMFLNKPILSYPVQMALESGFFDEVMVSTDDPEIAKSAVKLGAKVPFMRSLANADDFATTVDVILEVVNKYQEQGEYFNYICCLYPTAPFVTTHQLERAFMSMKEQDYDSVLPVMKFGYPIQRALKLNDGKISLFQPEHLNSRSQDLEMAYHDCGQFYWLNTDRFLAKKRLWTDNTGAIVLEEMEAHDIDTEEDWKVAEFKYKMINRVLDRPIIRSIRP